MGQLEEISDDVLVQVADTATIIPLFIDPLSHVIKLPQSTTEHQRT